MNYKTSANVLGKLLIITGISMLFPIICSLYYGENDLYSLAATGLISIGLGYPLWRSFRRYGTEPKWAAYVLGRLEYAPIP